MNSLLGSLRRGGGPLLGLAATWLLFALLAGGMFTRWPNQELMLLQTAVVGIAAIGATWIIIGGGIDLAVGSNIALSAMVGAMVLRAGGSWPLAAMATIAAGATIGTVIGALVTGALVRVVAALLAGWLVWLLARSLPTAAALSLPAIGAGVAWWATRALPWVLPLSPFIVTLGLWGALRGLAKGLGNNQPVYFPADAGLTALMLPGGALLPIGVWILLAAVALGALTLRYTVFGRHVIALGSNRDTARLCGIDTVRVERSIYGLAGACAGLAAVLQLSFLSMGDPTTAQGYELKAIAAAVIGGASLSGGEGSIVGTLLGAFVMTVVDNGCTKLGLDNWVQEIATGAIILGAVALDRWRHQRS